METPVVIVATGPSVEGVQIPDDVHVIAVNGAIEWLDHVDTFFTLDPSVRVREMLVHRRIGVNYVMAVPDDYGQPDARVKAHRDPPEQCVTYMRRITGDGPYKSCPTLSEQRAAIHTGNSAYGALGLAYHWRPPKIALLGVDLTLEPYAYTGGFPRDQFDHVPDLFASALPQLNAAGIQVVNGSLNSGVTCFERMTPSQAMEWVVS